jgi:hypothetical protein
MTALGEDLARTYPPLGSGEGKEHTDKLFRFRLKDGTICVAESAYPNVWLRFGDYNRNKPRFLAASAEKRVPESAKSGFHSNVLSTEGFSGQTMILLQAKSGAARDEIRTYLASFR